MTATPQENAALIRRFLTDVVAGGDIDAVDGFLAADAVDCNLIFGADHGRETVNALGWQVFAAADVDITIEDTVATADRVAVRATVTGTHRESLMDLTPTGRSFEIACAWFCLNENGRIVAIHSLPDGLGLMRELGVVPESSMNCPLTKSNDQPEK